MSITKWDGLEFIAVKWRGLARNKMYTTASWQYKGKLKGSKQEGEVELLDQSCTEKNYVTFKANTKYKIKMI